VLQNFIWENTDRFRVFMSVAFYRWRGDVRGQPGAPHHRVACPGVHPCHHQVWLPLALLRLFFGLRLAMSENRNFGLCFVQFQEYFLCNIFKTQNNRRNWHCGISLIG
jgi:hypothetical protein